MHHYFTQSKAALAKDKRRIAEDCKNKTEEIDEFFGPSKLFCPIFKHVVSQIFLQMNKGVDEARKLKFSSFSDN